MLFGEYEHTLDPKGRLAMPAKLREGLGNHFMVTKGLDECLFVFDMEQWQLLEEKLKSLPLTGKTARNFTRFLFGGACECECDKQGRILLPPNLRAHAGLEKDAVIVGVGTRAEIWSKEKYAAYNEASADDNFEALESLGI